MKLILAVKMLSLSEILVFVKFCSWLFELDKSNTNTFHFKKYKELENHSHLCKKKTFDKLKIKNLQKKKIHQGIEVTKKTTTMKSGVRGIQKIIANISLPEAEAAGGINWYKFLIDNFSELLENKCGLTCDFKNS